MRSFYFITLCLAFLPFANLAHNVSKTNDTIPSRTRAVPPELSDPIKPNTMCTDTAGLNNSIELDSKWSFLHRLIRGLL